MDIKYRIVISIFIIVILFYFVQFVITYMKSFKKRESFTNEYYDDVEHYEEPKTSTKKSSFKDDAPNQKTADDKMQSLRLSLLTQIQEVQDKEVKGNLLEYLFSDTMLNKLNAMSAAEQTTFVKGAITDLSGKTSTPSALSAPSAPSAPTKTSEPTNSITHSETTPSPQPVVVEKKSPFTLDLPSYKDYYENGSENMTHQISEALDNVSKSLANAGKGITDIKSIFVNKTPAKEPYIPSLPKLPIADVGVETFVNGYENVKSWGAQF